MVFWPSNDLATNVCVFFRLLTGLCLYKLPTNSIVDKKGLSWLGYVLFIVRIDKWLKIAIIY